MGGRGGTSATRHTRETSTVPRERQASQQQLPESVSVVRIEQSDVLSREFRVEIETRPAQVRSPLVRPQIGARGDPTLGQNHALTLLFGDGSLKGAGTPGVPACD